MALHLMKTNFWRMRCLKNADRMSKVQNLIDARVHEYYWKQDLNCAVTTLKILSELFCITIHPQVMDAAFGLNAGRAATQCGLIEGSLMFIGVYGSREQIESSKIQELCQNFSKEFQQKFNSLLCNELRPQGFCPENPPHLCEKLTKLAILFSAEFILGAMEGS